MLFVLVMVTVSVAFFRFTPKLSHNNKEMFSLQLDLPKNFGAKNSKMRAALEEKRKQIQNQRYGVQ